MPWGVLLPTLWFGLYIAIGQFVLDAVVRQRTAYALTDEGQELAGALRLLADWGSRVARDAEPLRHAACGTQVEARWYCPTCDRPVEGREAEEIRRV